MHNSRTYRPREEADQARIAVGPTAGITESAAPQKVPDAGLLAATAASVTEVRRLLEADARRARTFAGVALVGGMVVALVVASIALFTVNASWARERDFQDRLLEENSRRLSLEGAVGLQRALAQASRDELQQIRESQQATQAQLSATLRQLDGAQAELQAVQRDRSDGADRDLLGTEYVTREEHRQVRGLLHIMLQELLAARSRQRCMTTERTSLSAGDMPADESNRARQESASQRIVWLTVPDSPSLSGLPYGDAKTHEGYMNSSGICTGP